MVRLDIMKIMLLEGPNLNMVGVREPEVYGGLSSEEEKSKIKTWAEEKKIFLESRNISGEGAIVDCINGLSGGFNALIINPGALSHSSFSIRDSLKGLDIPVVEVHLSAVHSRPESWRKQLVTADAGHPVISGFGFEGYKMAIRFLIS
tara:strand:+ start:937 stop:1380 length:444 start_codon:yes stop_codon:yes gene_type:complete